MFKGSNKQDLRLIAEELKLQVEDDMTIADLIKIIKDSEIFKNDSETVKFIANVIIDERKANEKLSLEREKIQTELELARLKSDVKPRINEETESLDSLVRSIRTLTIKVPTKPEGWGVFFASLERAFSSKVVPEKYKAEILLNLLGERASNIINYIKDEDLLNYTKIREIVLREFQPTPYSYLEHFKKTSRLPNETHVQFASRLVAGFDYYLQLRNVSDFETLKQLMVSDKLFQTLDKDTASHISIRQGDGWFAPAIMAKEVDLYFTSRGRSINESLRATYKPNYPRNVSKVFYSDVKIFNCIMCNENHRLGTCPSYLKLNVNERIEFVKSNKLCFNCLNLHLVSNCDSKYSCFCKKRHHKTLHFPKSNACDKQDYSTSFRERSYASSVLEPQSDARNETIETLPSANVNPVVATSFTNSKPRNVLLSTVRVLVKSRIGDFVEVRCLLDCGSQACLMSQECANRLQLKSEKNDCLISCLNDSSMVVNGRITTTIANKDKTFKREVTMLIVRKITDLIPQRVLNVNFENLDFIPLADHSFNVPGKIDMLLGAEVFYELLRPGQIHAPNSNLRFQNSVFGYVAGGTLDQVEEVGIHCGLILHDDLNKTLRQFWEIENVDYEFTGSTEASLCEDNFVKTHKRDETGRYIVSMPLSRDPSCFGNSKDIAVRQLNSLWRRLSRDDEYLSLYAELLKEYEELGHLEKVVESREPPINYYIPHHGVLRPDKLTTKLRVVFNASCPTTSGVSLNDILLKGEVKEDVFETVSRYRKHKFAFTTDIQKMYRQILIDSDQWNLQRIVWKPDLHAEVSSYRLKTVTYGTSNAPFLAVRTLQQLAEDERSRFPLAAEVLLQETYMDDIVGGAPDLETARELQLQLRDALQSCGMCLHKWSSNSPELLNSSLSSEVEHSFAVDTDLSVKTLGMGWKPFQDVFVFKVALISKPLYTKREVLSVIARLYDPLGFLGPVITKAKILMQRLWQQKLDWDDVLPSPIADEWKEIVSTIRCIENVRITRFILTNVCWKMVLQGFADASEAAYGAVVYLQSFL